MVKEEVLTAKVKELMLKPEQIRNIGIVAHIDHGKTTMTDSLLAGAGMISEELAGKQLFMDFIEQERERGITIYAANASMVHTFDGKDYLINLIDTPGHVDFGGDVTRAMRAVDGAVVVICAVEGVMPQTETVLRQALRERVKPILFINKVDRLILELKLTPQDMQARFERMIAEVNRLIKKYAEPEYKKWAVRVEDGSVCFGSALRNWAISLPHMQKTGITFKQIIDLCSSGEDKKIWERSPLYKILLDAIIRHLPNPKQAQKYRIEKIWPGEVDSDMGKNMINCNPDGKLAAIVTKIVEDPHAGTVATARIFSGRINAGQEARLIAQHRTERVQQVCIYRGPKRVAMDYVVAGNIVGIIGLPSAFSGETICDPMSPIQPFEAIKHIFEPVVTKAIEAKQTADLPKLIDFLHKLSREDPTITVKIDQETGEHLVSGLGELHLDAKVERVLREKGIEIKTSPPIVVYRETVDGVGGPVEGKSPNKHNKFYLRVSPLPSAVWEAMVSGEIRDQEVKKKNPELTKKLQELGLEREAARGVKEIYNRCIFSDITRGIQYLHEAMELVKQGVRSVIDSGPITGEPCSALLIELVDAELHEDAIHRGPAQVIPAVRFSIRNSVLKAKPTLLEPKQTIRIDCPEEEMGAAMREVQNRRGIILDARREEGAAILRAKMPVSEMFGFEAAMKSATGGKGFYSLIDVEFEPLPRDLLLQTVEQIRKRKGLPGGIPQPEA